MPPVRTRGHWSVQALRKALDAIKGKELTIGKAAMTYDIPKSTLLRHLHKTMPIPENYAKSLGGAQAVFTHEQEQNLVKYCLDMVSRLFGLTGKQLRQLAYDYAEANNIKHKFSNKIAGKKWLRGFMARNPDLTLRTPEKTSYSRALGFNKFKVGEYFDHLEGLQNKYDFPPQRIYNLDETGVQTVQTKPKKVLAKKGVHRVGALTSYERGKNVTVVSAMNAAGHHVPPAFIFPRKRLSPQLLNDKPACSVAYVNETGSGWMTKEVFVQYMKHFQQHVKSSKESPTLLIVDGHKSHTQSLEAIKFANQHGIVMLSLPPHTSHLLQPLDVGFFGPFKRYYDQYIDAYLKQNPGEVFTEFKVAAGVKYAFEKSATFQISANSFKKTSISPLNRHVFTEDDFKPSDTTEQTLTETNPEKMLSKDRPVTIEVVEVDNLMEIVMDTMTKLLDSVEQAVLPPAEPFAPNTVVDVEISMSAEDIMTATYHIMPQEISPFPKAQRKPKRNNTKKTGSVVITGTPHKRSLEEASQSIKKRPKKSAKKPKTSRKILQASTSEDCECIVCGESYLLSNEDWLQCMKCHEWAHISCANPEGSKFICDLCM